jgi:oligoendopeptidase F
MRHWLDTTPALAPYRHTILDEFRKQRPCAGREGRAHPVAGRPHQCRAAHGVRGTQHLGHQVPDADLQRRPDRHPVTGAYAALLESNPHQADRAKAAAGAPQHLRRQRQHLRRHLQGRARARLVPGPGAQLRQHAGRRAARQQHPAQRWSRTWSPPPAPAPHRCSATSGCARSCSACRSTTATTTSSRCFRTDTRTPTPPRASWCWPRWRRWARTTAAATGASWPGGRIDVYESEGKRSGAYNAGVYGVGPYLLLNHNDTMDAMFTLAHEAGHAMHTVLSHEHQPFVTADYTIFVAEVASTTNERFLLEHLLRQTTDPKERFLLLQHAARPDPQHLLHAVDVRRLRAAGAPSGGTGPAGHDRGAERALPAAAEGLLRRRSWWSTRSTSGPGRASGTSSTRPTTSTSTRPASRRRRSCSRR